MTSLFPHAEYAEDQPYSKEILTLHVLRAGAPAGVIVSFPIAAALTVFRGPRTWSNLSQRLVLSSCRGLIWGTALSGLALAGRMWGKEQIEWQDRSWRLQENRFQSEVDWWILDGAVVGAVTSFLALRRGKLPPALLAKRRETVIGGAGFGTMLGTIGFMGWRHGVKRGKYNEER